MITIPSFSPRHYQLPFLKAMDEGCKRAVLVWHRRAGKEVTCWNWLIKMAFWHRVGTYIYFFPTSTLGRRILWDGMDKEGKRFQDYIPAEIRDGEPNKVDMKIRLKNGSIIQIMGTDQIINVGTNPVGVVFSEFSLQNPHAWQYISPILRENGGWAVFNFTPRGRNHAYDHYLMAKNNSDWFCQKLTIDDTGILTKEDMDKERSDGFSEHMIQQEYYCSFDQGVEGSIYAKLLTNAELEGRICNLEYDPAFPVNTHWDLGVSDATCILFTQNVGKSIHLLDMYTSEGEGIQHYVNILRKKAEENGYTYGKHFAPHDIKVRELSSGAMTRLEIAQQLGLNFEIVPKLGVIEGLELGRVLFPKLWINKNKCKYFIKAAENYHKVYNSRLNVYSDLPEHDWSSHCMDSYRYLAVTQSLANREEMTEEEAYELRRKHMRKF